MPWLGGRNGWSRYKTCEARPHTSAKRARIRQRIVPSTRKQRPHATAQSQHPRPAQHKAPKP
eukprot:3603557-Rhodomonas_salina.1